MLVQVNRAAKSRRKHPKAEPLEFANGRAHLKAVETLGWGCVDELSLRSIAGWAWDPLRPDEALELELLDGDQYLMTIKANMFRQDLLDSGCGNGFHGFVVDNIAFLLPKSRHLLRVRCARTKAELPGSPRLAIRVDSGFDDRAADFIEGVLSSVATHATDVRLIDEALSLVLGQLNELVNARFRLDSGTQHELQEVFSRVRLNDWTHELITQLLHSYRPIAIEPSPEPLVSVVVPVHDKFETTYRCIESIQLHPPKCPFEIVIVDDGSRDETLFASLVFSGAIRVIRTPRNGGFIEACNFGAKQARGAFIFFLNNDTLVRENWLDALVETFETVPDIGIAGSRLFSADGSLQEVGGIIWKMGDGWNWGRGADPAAPQFNYLRDTDYVSGAALLIRRALFEELGGFDLHYRPAYYEDTDLCFKVRAAGKRVVVQPASEIVHLEGVSNGTDVAGTGLKRHQVANQRKFFLRWKDTLSRHRANGQHPMLEVERGVTRRAYFLDDTALTPEQDAGSNAALQHILALQQLGYKVTFIPSDNMARLDPHTRALEKLGVECLYAPFFWSVEEVLRKTAIAPDLVYFHRFSNASKYATMVREWFPNCRLVYNVADLHFLREMREAELADDPVLRTAAALKRKRELGAMQLVDCVIVHSTVEAALLRELQPEMPVQVVSWAVSPRPTAIPFGRRAGYAFVGGFRHPPNVDAVRWFADSILPELPPMPEHRFVVIGSNMPEKIARLHGKQIDVRGHVPVLADALHAVRCTIAPLRYGAGVKGKVLESFAHGLPCLMSEIAAEGLPIEGDLTWLIVRSAAEWSEKMERLLIDEDWNCAMAAAGMKFLQSEYSAASMLVQMSKTLS